MAISNKYTERIEDAWAAFGAAQSASTKTFKESIIDPWTKIATGSVPEEKVDAQAFKRAIKGGF